MNHKAFHIIKTKGEHGQTHVQIILKETTDCVETQDLLVSFQYRMIQNGRAIEISEYNTFQEHSSKKDHYYAIYRYIKELSRGIFFAINTYDIDVDDAELSKIPDSRIGILGDLLTPNMIMDMFKIELNTLLVTMSTPLRDGDLFPPIFLSMLWNAFSIQGNMDSVLEHFQISTDRSWLEVRLSYSYKNENGRVFTNYENIPLMYRQILNEHSVTECYQKCQELIDRYKNIADEDILGRAKMIRGEIFNIVCTVESPLHDS